MNRAAAYTRTSTRDRQNAENQRQALRDFAARHGYDLMTWYEDTASGASQERPAFRQMMTDAHAGAFDLVLFWSLDRFSREGTAATLRHLQQLRAAKVAFRSVTEPYLDTLGPFGDAVIGLLATIAEFERRRLRERVNAGLERARKEGKRLGRPAAILDRQKAQDLIKDGHSIRDAARILGVPYATLHARLKD